MTKDELDTTLAKFYAEARKIDGSHYSRSALLQFRYAIQRYLNNPPFSRGFELNSDPKFSKSNKTLDAVIKSQRRQGFETVQHKPVIMNNDMVKLQESGIFNIDEPIGLLYGAWFYIMLHFCRRGREGQRELRPDSFVIMHDDRNCPYLTMTHMEVSKNYQGGVKEDDTFESEARLYESNDHNGFALVKNVP